MTPAEVIAQRVLARDAGRDSCTGFKERDGYVNWPRIHTAIGQEADRYLREKYADEYAALEQDAHDILHSLL